MRNRWVSRSPCEEKESGERGGRGKGEGRAKYRKGATERHTLGERGRTVLLPSHFPPRSISPSCPLGIPEEIDA
jgi:hypothetical protein